MNTVILLCSICSFNNTQDVGTAILTFAEIEAKISKYQAQITHEPMEFGKRGEVLSTPHNKEIARRNEQSRTSAATAANKELAGVHFRTAVQVAFPAEENVISLAMPVWVNAPTSRVSMNHAKAPANVPIVRIPFEGDWGKKLKRNDFIQLEGIVSKIELAKYELKVSLAGMSASERKKDKDKDKDSK